MAVKAIEPGTADAPEVDNDPRKQLAITAPASWLAALATHVEQTGFAGSTNVWVGELVGRTIGVPFPPVNSRTGGTTAQRKTKAATRKASELLSFFESRGGDVGALAALLATMGIQLPSDNGTGD